MTTIGIIDAGPFVAWASTDDLRHAAMRAILQDSSLRLVVPALVITEATYLIASRLGPHAEAALLEAIAGFEIECPTTADYRRMTQLMRQYADFPIGTADASVVALAERLDTDLIVTTDRRHFSAIRPSHCEAFRLLPE